MSDFSLAFNQSKVFPEKLKSRNGETFPINADFRNILKIQKLLEDESVIDRMKIGLILKWFYTGTVPPDSQEAVKLIYDFIGGKQSGTGPPEKIKPQFDYELDAEEIYASFLADYNIDLMQCPFMHWYKFRILLQNLSSESPFAQKIHLRFMDLKGYKGERYAKLSRAKRKAQIPVKYSKEETNAINKLRKRLKR